MNERKLTWRDMIILAIDMGTGVSYSAGTSPEYKQLMENVGRQQATYMAVRNQRFDGESAILPLACGLVVDADVVLALAKQLQRLCPRLCWGCLFHP